MNTRQLSFVAIATILIGLWAGSVRSQSATHFDVEVGYQTVDVDGDEDLYRTLINQDDGFVLRGLSIHHIDSSGEAGFLDDLRIDAAGFGGNPAGHFRLWAGLARIYRFRLFYSEYENFSALPAWANPNIADGVTPGQHTWDRNRKILNVELELLPNRVVTPLIGYRYNTIDGPRRTTYHAGQNEYQLSSNLEETEQELYAGILFRTDNFSGTVIQGWREYDATDRLSLAPGEQYGNVQVPILGVDQYVDDLSRTMKTDAETPVTTANLRGNIADLVDVSVTYVRADTDTDASSSEMLSGSLVSYRISRFFQGFDQTVETRTESPMWRAAGVFNVHLGESVRLDLGFEEHNRSLDGWSLVSSLYLDTLNFGGFDPRDVETLVEAHNGYDRDDQVVNARLNVSDIGPVSLWAEAGYTRTDLRLSEDVSQIVTAGGQQGAFDRTTTRLAGGASLLFGTARISLDITNESSDDIIVRTDFDSRLRFRGRADLPIVKWLRVLGTAEHIESSNGSSGVGYDATTDHYAVELNIDPTESFSLRLAWDDYTTDTSMPILIPQTLQPTQSIYNEEGTLLEGGLLWKISIVSLDLGYSEFSNEGSFGFDLNRAFARIGFDVTKSWAISAEYENNDYSEAVLDLAQFDADRYAIYLRWHR